MADESPAVDASGIDQRPVAEPDEPMPIKHQIYKYWNRPRSNQYNYMYDYRRNYYDDVLNYLDRRQKGLRPELPRAQTWAERALRTYNNKIAPSTASEANKKDTILVSHINTGVKFHAYHSKAYINRKLSGFI